jgi:hypothetical protein
MPLRPGREGTVDPLGQLIKGEPASHEVLPQLDHRGVAFRVADPQVMVVPAVPGQTPSRY